MIEDTEPPPRSWEEPAAERPAAGFPWPPPPDAGMAASAEALADTWRRSVFRPTPFFQSLPHRGAGPALVYFLIIGVLAAGIGLFWSSVIGAAFPDQPEWLRALGYGGGSGPDAAIAFLLSPLVLLFALAVTSAVSHVLLLLLGASAGGYAATLRVFCYSAGPQLFAILPVLGDVLAPIWALVLTVIGVREAHRTSTARAVMALVVLPLFLLLLLGLVVGLGVALLGIELPAR